MEVDAAERLQRERDQRQCAVDGHASVSAALRHQLATNNQDRVLADAFGALVKPATGVPIDRMTHDDLDLRKGTRRRA